MSDYSNDIEVRVGHSKFAGDPLVLRVRVEKQVLELAMTCEGARALAATLIKTADQHERQHGRKKPRAH